MTKQRRKKTPMDDRDLVIVELADAEAARREQIVTLVDTIADLAFESVLLCRVLERELIERIHGDATVARTRRALRERRQRAHQATAA